MMGAAGIVIAIDPVILRVGSFELRWYGIFVALALLAGYWVLMRELRRRGLPEEPVAAALPWIVAAGVLGARAFHVVDRLGYYLQHPRQILALQQGGLAIWGGVACGVAAGVLLLRGRGLPLGALLDAAVPALLTGQIVGRLGCVVNGDAWGAPTTLPWGFVYTNPAALLPPELLGVPTHPYPVYEMLWNGATLLLLLRLRPRLGGGRLFLAYLALYSVGRFLLTAVRQERAVLLGLQQAQILSLATVAACIAAWLLLRRFEARRVR